MSRWGILSDIHGNLAALDRALAICRERGVERYAVVGDNLGRGDSAGCVERIRALADLSVVGNRDLDWIDRCGEPVREYVLALPRVARADDLILSHGDARLTPDLSSAEIKRGFRRARRRLADEGARLWLFGHTHRARIWRLGDADDAELLFDAAVAPLPVSFSLPDPDPAVRWAINVGSVGLPFPGKGPPSFAIYDAEANEVAFLPI